LAVSNLNLKSPTSYTGQPGTKYRQGTLRLATETEAVEGQANNVAVNPLQLSSQIHENFSSPPQLGNVTPNKVFSSDLYASSEVGFNLTGDVNILSEGDVTISAEKSFTIIAEAQDLVGILIQAYGDIRINSRNAAINLLAEEDKVLIGSTSVLSDALKFRAFSGGIQLTASAGTLAMNSSEGIILNSGQTVAVTQLSSVQSPYSVLALDYFLSCDTSLGVLTIVLPAASSCLGRTIVIRDSIGNVSVNNITIVTAGGNLVGGGSSDATKILSSNYSGATVFSNGTTWNYTYIA
jgi:hypothetical protein